MNVEISNREAVKEENKATDHKKELFWKNELDRQQNLLFSLFRLMIFHKTARNKEMQPEVGYYVRV